MTPAVAVPITAVAGLAIAAAVSDVRTGRIPNRLILYGLATLAGSLVLVALADGQSLGRLLADMAAGVALSGAPAMFLIWLVAPRLLGGGDWKMLTVLGLAIGMLAPLGATVIVVGAFTVALVLAVLQRRRQIVLGPPLAFGFVLAVLAVVILPDLFVGPVR